MKKKIDIICIITARSGSKGLKNKNIRKLKGLPLIAHTIIAAKKSKMLTRVILSTDSKLYAKIGSKFGVEVPFIRPKRLATNTAHHPDVVNHALNFVEKKDRIKFDYVVMLQPTSPFRKAKHIKESIKIFEKNYKADCLVSVQKCPHNMIPESLMRKSKNFVQFNQKNLLFRKQDKPNYFARNGAAIYITKYNRIQNYILGGKILYYEMNKIDSIDIDDYEDLEISRIIAKKINL